MELPSALWSAVEHAPDRPHEIDVAIVLAGFVSSALNRHRLFQFPEPYLLAQEIVARLPVGIALAGNLDEWIDLAIAASPPNQFDQCLDPARPAVAKDPGIFRIELAHMAES